MDHTSRKRKRRKEAPATEVDTDRLELELAESSPPYGEENPRRVTSWDLRAFADVWRDWKPERGRLH